MASSSELTPGQAYDIFLLQQAADGSAQALGHAPGFIVTVARPE